MKIISLDKASHHYPSSLKRVLGEDGAPDVLHIMGNVALLQKSGIGISGSRRARDVSISIARDCADQAVSQGLTIISGYAKGVDLAAHYQALASGGETVIVLPYGLSQFRVQDSLAPVWDWSRVAVISQWDMDAPWSTPQAMERNSTIIGLSAGLIVVQAAINGGSISAGFEALRLKHPLGVPRFGDNEEDVAGNHELLRLGGMPLMRNRQTGRVNLSPLLSLIGKQRSRSKTRVVVGRKPLSPELCRAHPEALFVFGDNLMRKGKGGQAIIRDEPNAFGIATKVSPSNDDAAFFRDTCKRCESVMLEDIERLKRIIASRRYEYVVLPAAGIGTGRARLPERAPKLFSHIVRLYQMFGLPCLFLQEPSLPALETV